MKKKLIEKIPVPKLRNKSGKFQIKVTEYQDGIVIDIYDRYENYCGRYAMATGKGEFEVYKNGQWSKERFGSLVDCNPMYYGAFKIKEEIAFDTKKDEKIFIKLVSSWEKLYHMEAEYGKDRRIKAKENRYNRYRELMGKIPEIPEGFTDWMKNLEEIHYTFKDAKNKEYYCSACGHIEQIKNGPSHGAIKRCPECSRITIVKSRTKSVKRKGNVALMQNIDEKISVVRHFSYEVTAELEDTGEGYVEAKERILYSEDVRLVMYRPKGYAIFYDQEGEYREWWSGITRPEWSHQNPNNKRMRECYLYPKGIEEALKGTDYECLSRAFTAMAAARVKGKYNEVMAVAARSRGIGNVLEYLHKGRFRKLLSEIMDSCDCWNGCYYGKLNLYGTNEKEVFGLSDRQRIFRIREKNGGNRFLQWMQYEEKYQRKLSEKFMSWAERENIFPDNIKELPVKMSPEKIMNYIEKQKANYRLPTRGIIEQWLDYLDMCRATGKAINDALFYAPKNLKEAHDSMIIQKEKLEIVKAMRKGKEAREVRAQEVREKFPEAQENLQYAADRYSYVGQEYVMKIPTDLYEIVEEGAALHHCGGASDRYFNRIANKETYIGFCRRVGEEGIPYYTIEFEPDGTVRQSRTLNDGEEGIEEIRGFVKEWQKEVKKRLTEEDKAAAVKSAVLREENIRELKEKGNTFVLRKLLEDFMEAV